MANTIKLYKYELSNDAWEEYSKMSAGTLHGDEHFGEYIEFNIEEKIKAKETSEELLSTMSKEKWDFGLLTVTESYPEDFEYEYYKSMEQAGNECNCENNTDFNENEDEFFQQDKDDLEPTDTLFWDINGNCITNKGEPVPQFNILGISKDAFKDATKTKIGHPLIDNNAVHYVDVDGKQTIEEIEEELTIGELIGACEFNILKYRKRNKGQDTSDLVKIRKYRDYLNFLGFVVEEDIGLKDVIASDAYRELKLNIQYR